MATTPEELTAPSFDREVGARLKSSREAIGMTQQNVGVRSKMADPEGKGISRTALIGYEAGTSRPGLREIRLLCEVLKISPNWLIFGMENPVQTELASLDLVRQSNVKDAIRAGFAIAALKGHEREALLSMALSLAGRQLGDLRLSFLLAFASSLAPSLEADLVSRGLSDEISLEELMDRMSSEGGASFGNRLKIDDEINVSGTWLYTDPKEKSEN